MLLWRAISVGVCMDLRIFFQLKAQMRDVIFQAKQVIVKCNASDLLHVFIAFFCTYLSFFLFFWGAFFDNQRNPYHPKRNKCYIFKIVLNIKKK